MRKIIILVVTIIASYTAQSQEFIPHSLKTPLSQRLPEVELMFAKDTAEVLEKYYKLYNESTAKQLLLLLVIDKMCNHKYEEALETLKMYQAFGDKRELNFRKN